MPPLSLRHWPTELSVLTPRYACETIVLDKRSPENKNQNHHTRVNMMQAREERKEERYHLGEEEEEKVKENQKEQEKEKNSD